jgi:hypothetical protein
VEWDDATVSMARPCCRSPGVGGDEMDMWRICEEDKVAVLVGEACRGRVIQSGVAKWHSVIPSYSQQR